jgi:RHS repeat-associated protein/uncharacterized delta-60 repeat protein
MRRTMTGSGQLNHDYTPFTGDAYASGFTELLVARLTTTGQLDTAAGVRLNADGSLDTSFNATGHRQLPTSSTSRISALIVQPDGKIVGTGRSDSQAFIYRVNDNGSTDNTFGTSGEVRHDLSTGSQDVWNGMAYTFDGKLVVSGVATGDFALGRFGAGGSMLMGANAAMSQRLWFQQDANFNVTSVSNDATGGNGGVAVERYVYTPYGQRTVLHSDFTPVAGGASLFGVDEGHQGLSADAETGLVYNRHRYLHVTLGRFTSPDPHPQGRYVDGMNGYEYVRSGPVGAVDPSGLETDDFGVRWDSSVDWQSHPHARPDGWIPGKGYPPGHPKYNTRPTEQDRRNKLASCPVDPDRPKRWCDECQDAFDNRMIRIRSTLGSGFGAGASGAVTGILSGTAIKLVASNVISGSWAGPIGWIGAGIASVGNLALSAKHASNVSQLKQDAIRSAHQALADCMQNCDSSRLGSRPQYRNR